MNKPFCENASNIQKFLKHFIYKSAQTIVQSRLGEIISTYSKPLDGHEWFNLSILNLPDVNEQLGSVLLNTESSLLNTHDLENFDLNDICIEISLKTTDQDTLILEYWHIICAPKQSNPIYDLSSANFNKSKAQSSLKNDHPLVINMLYERLGVVLKALISISRSLPGYRIARYQCFPDSTYAICYRIIHGFQRRNDVKFTEALGEDYKKLTIGNIEYQLSQQESQDSTKNSRNPNQTFELNRDFDISTSQSILPKHNGDTLTDTTKTIYYVLSINVNYRTNFILANYQPSPQLSMSTVMKKSCLNVNVKSSSLTPKSSDAVTIDMSAGGELTLNCVIKPNPVKDTTETDNAIEQRIENLNLQNITTTHENVCSTPPPPSSSSSLSKEFNPLQTRKPTTESQLQYPTPSQTQSEITCHQTTLLVEKPQYLCQPPQDTSQNFHLLTIQNTNCLTENSDTNDIVDDLSAHKNYQIELENTMDHNMNLCISTNVNKETPHSLTSVQSRTNVDHIYFLNTSPNTHDQTEGINDGNNNTIVDDMFNLSPKKYLIDKKILCNPTLTPTPTIPKWQQYLTQHNLKEEIINDNVVGIDNSPFTLQCGDLFDKSNYEDQLPCTSKMNAGDDINMDNHNIMYDETWLSNALFADSLSSTNFANTPLDKNNSTTSNTSPASLKSSISSVNENLSQTDDTGDIFQSFHDWGQQEDWRNENDSKTHLPYNFFDIKMELPFIATYTNYPTNHGSNQTNMNTNSIPIHPSNTSNCKGLPKSPLLTTSCKSIRHLLTHDLLKPPSNPCNDGKKGEKSAQDHNNNNDIVSDSEINANPLIFYHVIERVPKRLESFVTFTPWLECSMGIEDDVYLRTPGPCTHRCEKLNDFTNINAQNVDCNEGNVPQCSSDGKNYETSHSSNNNNNVIDKSSSPLYYTLTDIIHGLDNQIKSFIQRSADSNQDIKG